MHYMRFLHLLAIQLFLLSVVLLSCSSSPKNSEKTLQPTDDALSRNNLKVGGLYIIRGEDSSFYVVKILALDNFAVHLRTYSEKLESIPSHLNSDSLEILIGHSPIDQKSFLNDKPRLINVENVREEELDGYKLYMEEMKKNSQ